MEYNIGLCDEDNKKLPESLPSAEERIFRITLTRLSDAAEGRRLQIHCNDKEVLNVKISAASLMHSLCHDLT